MQTFLFFILPSLIVLAFFITPKKKSLRWLLNVIKVAAILFFVQSVVRIYWYDIYIVSSGSMERTFFKGDIIFVDKNQKENIERNDVMLFHPNCDKTGLYLVKRCIGLPADTVSIKDGILCVNATRFKETENVRMQYRVWTNNPEKFEKIADANQVWDYRKVPDEKVFELTLSPDEAREFRNTDGIDSITIKVFDKDSVHFVYPKTEKWTITDYGPLVVPYSGMKIELNERNYQLYQRTIRGKEKVKIKPTASGFLIDDKIMDFYTFKNNYYFMMGDNRYNSMDSRYWGFVPEENIVGRATTVLFSNSNKGFNRKRFMKPIR